MCSIFCCDYIYTYIVKSEQFDTFKDHNLIIQIVRMKKKAIYYVIILSLMYIQIKWY